MVTAAGRITAVYVIVGALWIILSDRLLGALVKDPVAMTGIATVKGWLYVVVTGWMLYALIGRTMAARQRVETALAESEERLRLAQQAAGIGAWDWNLQTGELAWSAEQNRIFGVPGGPSRATHEPVLEMVHPDDRPRIEELIRQVSANGGDMDVQFRIIRPDGVVRTIASVGRSHPDRQGRPAHMHGISMDITDRLQLEEQLLHAQKLESVGRLAGGVAHDFNNLLTAIIGYTDLAAESMPPDHPGHSYLGSVRTAAHRAAALTRQLLAFARKQVVEPRILSINDLLPEVGRMLRRLIGEDIELEVVPGPDLGLVCADPGQVEQIVMNMAVNARDAMPEGGRLLIETANATLDEEYCRLHVDVASGEYVMLAITDTGVGMTREVKGRIFEPFFTTKERGTGTGLGLATCYGIAKQSGGHIAVHSEEGRGTTFRVYLPRVNGKATPDSAQAVVRALPSGSETILLVEDEPLVRGAAAEALRSQGYRVLEAVDGPEALEIARKLDGSLDLLLTDMVMPQMGGRELAAELAGIRPGVRVLYISGYPEGAITPEGELEPGIALLHKPFTPIALAQRVRDVLDSPAGQPA